MPIQLLSTLRSMTTTMPVGSFWRWRRCHSDQRLQSNRAGFSISKPQVSFHFNPPRPPLEMKRNRATECLDMPECGSSAVSESFALNSPPRCGTVATCHHPTLWHGLLTAPPVPSPPLWGRAQGEGETCEVVTPLVD